MRLVFFLFLLSGFSIWASCSGEKKAGAGRPRKIIRTVNDSASADSVVFIETEFEARQANDKEKLKGKWRLVTMRRQARADLELLENCWLDFSADSSFSGKASCNSIGGLYKVKGTSIRFSNIISTKMACDKLEQENWLVRLLEERIVAYSVTDEKLLLRDGSSNIVFECTR